MDSSSARRLAARTVSSSEAHVLPHLVEIAPPHEGVVARVFIMDDDVVSIGQHLVEIVCGAKRSLVKSSVPGVVSRCRVRVGDAVARSRPLLSIVRTDDVLVVARFEPSVGPELQSGDLVSVRFPRVTAQSVAATLIRVTGVHGSETSAARHEESIVRVVARLHSAPPAALWSGVQAVVDVACDG
jgi:multidrug resistance efflux pump